MSDPSQQPPYGSAPPPHPGPPPHPAPPPFAAPPPYPAPQQPPFGPVPPQMPPYGGVSYDGAGWSAAGAPISSAGKRLGGYLLEALLLVVTLFIGWLVWSLIVWSRGQTPAKSLLGMRCIRTDTGRVATWGTMALRELVGKLILGNLTFGITTLVSCFMVLGASRQGVWDKVATTVVVDDPDGRLR